MNLVLEHIRSDFLSRGPLPVQERKKRLQDLRNVIAKNESSLNEALRVDLGKSPFESYATEVGFILSEISFLLKHLDCWTSPKRVKTPLNLFPGKSSIHAEPLGVVFIIAPWNYPFQLCLYPLLGAIAAGNRVVLKPSEFAPRTSAVIRKVLSDVFPASEVGIVEGGSEVVQDLLLEKFDHIFFTGSTKVGKIIMKAAAQHLTPVTLELGGKSPCLIEESAAIDVAAKRIAWGKFLNAGQTCVAPDYVLVPQGLQSKLIEKLKFYITKFYGEEIKASPDYPRIMNEKHFDRLHGLLKSGSIAFGGENHREERFLAPTILRDVKWSDEVMEDEIFGPILPVIPYSDLDEVLLQIKGRPKPLAFYLFTQNERRKEDILRRTAFGGGCVNDTVVHLANPNLPFGGVGESGIGSYHGKKTFDTFTHYKSIFEQRTLFDVPLRYPPFEGKLRWLKFFLG